MQVLRKIKCETKRALCRSLDTNLPDTSLVTTRNTPSG